MSKSKHPIEQEELMAYLDGELATNRAVEAAAHMEHCSECQELAADLRKLSQEMMAWEVEGPEAAEMPTEVVAALEKREKEPRKKIARRWDWRQLFTMRRLAWTGGGAVCVLLAAIFYLTNQPAMKPLSGTRQDNSYAKLEHYNGPSYPSSGPASPAPAAPAQALSSTPRSSFSATDKLEAQRTSEAGDNVAGLISSTHSEDEEIDTSERTVPSAPMIARTADLTLTTKEFEKTRAGLEEILKHHGGYLGELKVSAPADSGRALTATLRIPAAQFDAAMAELKKLGRVEFESQGGEEVTQQYVDLEARLANGKHTEQRLTEILRQRTGKLQEVLKVELEIDRVRGEIEQMQAEKKELSKRVAFATLNTTVKEEYFAKLQATPPSTGSRFSNAAVDGYNTAVEGLISVGLFLLSSGPSLLIWMAVLFFPVRWLWKRLKKAYSTRRRGDAEEEPAG
jgi:hypothetical protein